MNLKRALTGGGLILLGSFATGAVVKCIRSVRETMELHKKTEELEAESERLIKEAKEDIADSDKMVRDMDERIEQIKAEFERRKAGPDPMREEFERLIGRANKFMNETDEINKQTQQKQNTIEDNLEEFD